ncbi:MAG: peptidoglycan D,D-transpeptidase FtsI family protein [Limisphaerales bacterium]
MLIFDELKKNDPQLRFVAAGLAAGFCILLTGLWWVQIVSAGEYKSHLETQSYRTIRIPAMRGKILDCQGRVLAENYPRYNLDLFFNDLSADFQAEYIKLRRPIRVMKNPPPGWEFWKRSAAAVQRGPSLTRNQIAVLEWQARSNVACHVMAKMSQVIGRPLTFDYRSFARAYLSSLYVPYPIAQGLDPREVARFEENYSGAMGVDLDVQTTRIYPNGSLAEDVLGYVRQDDSSVQDEDAFFNYRLPDYSGVIGIEGARDKQLHGRAGVELVMVNNYGYRQTEYIGSEPEPGDNVVLTLDLDIQRAAEESLMKRQGPDTHAAIVVMNVRTGDVLGMVSYPALDPNFFTRNLPPDQMQRQYDMFEDTNLLPQINRATSGNYLPGSVFKPFVGLAALENGLDPNEIYHVEENPKRPGHGYIRIGNRNIGDLVPPGDYDFKKAIEMSSNAYFIYNGLRTGIRRVVAMAEKFHFGERTGVLPGQESKGIFPSLKKVEGHDWLEGDSAYICFGQGEMAVTPIQMAVAYSAIANGGIVLWPRLVARLEPQDPNGGETNTVYPSGLVRDRLNVHPRNLHILCDAMLGETEEGSGRRAQVPGLQICGKTGTAQVENEKGEFVSQNFWFCSFAPYSDPKYAVIVMIQKPYDVHGFGGTECAPIAHDIYTELLKKDPSIGTQVTRN